MIKRDFKLVIIVFTVLFALVFFFYQFIPEARSQTNHVVISEIQIAGDTSADEYVELYNPLPEDVDLTGWRLRRATSSGNESNLVASISGTIKAHGYYLIAHPDYDGDVTADETYSTGGSLADDNSIILDNGETVVDLVGLGEASLVETTATINPEDGQSLERKAGADSTAESMASGGADENLGNGHDTNNNSADFVLRTVPDPQNSSSAVESTEEPTPTSTPSPTPTTTVTPTITPSLTPTPTVTVTPTLTLTPTPTTEPTDIPTSTPTQEPTPTTTPEPTPTDVPDTVTIGIFNFPSRTLVCQIEYEVRTFRFFRFFVPHISCFNI